MWLPLRVFERLTRSPTYFASMILSPATKWQMSSVNFTSFLSTVVRREGNVALLVLFGVDSTMFIVLISKK